MKKKLTKQDITYLKRYAAKRKLAELAKRFKTQPAVVQKELDKLGLLAADSPKPVVIKPDPLLKVYEQALRALQKGKLAEAKKKFARVAGETDQRDLAERARRYLAICRKKAKPKAAKAKKADPYLQAVFEANRGKTEAALSICSRGGRYAKDDRFAHLAASIYARQGEHEKAAKYLTVAIELNPVNRVHAFHDPDFENLREEPEYAHLFEPE